MNIDIARLDDGDDIEATLMRHSAQWHKACRLRVNQTKLERLETKSKESDVETCPSAVTTRSRQDRVDLTEAVCFLCNQPAGSDVLHRACTHDIDVKVRKCAIELGPTCLPSLHLGTWLSWRQSITLNALLISTTEQELVQTMQVLIQVLN